MTRTLTGVALAVMFIIAAAAQAQTPPDLTGTWHLNQDKSGASVGGNGVSVVFSSEIVMKQNPTELQMTASGFRQDPVTALFKLDGSDVALQAPRGITDTGHATFEGRDLVITHKRSFTSPLGETVVQFKEIYSVNGNELTVTKTQTDDSGTATAKAVYDKV